MFNQLKLHDYYSLSCPHFFTATETKSLLVFSFITKYSCLSLSAWLLSDLYLESEKTSDGLSSAWFQPGAAGWAGGHV